MAIRELIISVHDDTLFLYRYQNKRSDPRAWFVPLLMPGNLFDTLLALDNQGVPPATVLRNSLAGGFPSAEDC